MFEYSSESVVDLLTHCMVRKFFASRNLDFGWITLATKSRPQHPNLVFSCSNLHIQPIPTGPSVLKEVYRRF
ncbi:hypothetical protein BC830DRAFT_630997 [Chytriomyces sp. MP71]|nr:hypothetical protein BC830DRAFT_630997 [Chytriomyces sp. MP71]